jgi:hypothetical protein
MKLDENYTLEGEEYNWILFYEKPTGKTNEKTGKEIVTKSKWYFPKIEQALKRYVNHAIKPSTAVQEVLKKQEELLEVIEGLTIATTIRRRK